MEELTFEGVKRDMEESLGSLFDITFVVDMVLLSIYFILLFILYDLVEDRKLFSLLSCVLFAIYMLAMTLVNTFLAGII